MIRGGPPSFWEIYDGLPTSCVLLQRLTDRLDGGGPLARATFRTVLHSYPRNRDRVSLGAAHLPAQVARRIRLGLLDPSALAASPATAPIRPAASVRALEPSRRTRSFIAQSAGFERPDGMEVAA